MEIADRRVATLHFTLLDQQGRQVATTQGHDPLVHVHGTGGIVRGLEDAPAGKRAGDRFEVEIARSRVSASVTGNWCRPCRAACWAMLRRHKWARS